MGDGARGAGDGSVASSPRGRRVNSLRGAWVRVSGGSGAAAGAAPARCVSGAERSGAGSERAAVRG